MLEVLAAWLFSSPTRIDWLVLGVVAIVAAFIDDYRQGRY